MERVFTSVTEVVNGFEPNSAARCALVMGSWSHVAGEMLSARAEAVAYDGGRLVVAVPDLTWKNNLESLAPQMVARMNAKLGGGTVVFIEFRVQTTQQRPSNREPRVIVEVPERLRDAADKIGDPDLRQTFLNAAAEYLKHH